MGSDNSFFYNGRLGGYPDGRDTEIANLKAEVKAQDLRIEAMRAALKGVNDVFKAREARGDDVAFPETVIGMVRKVLE